MNPDKKLSSRTVEKKERSNTKSSKTAKVHDFNCGIMHVDLINKKLQTLQDDSDTSKSPLTPNDRVRGSAKELRRRRETFASVEDSDVIARLNRLELASTLQNKRKTTVTGNEQEQRNDEEWQK